ALRCAIWTVLIPAPSAFWRKSRLPLSSTMQMVTCASRFLASVSAAPTMVLSAARLRYLRVGSSAALASSTQVRAARVKLIMRELITTLCESRSDRAGRHAGAGRASQSHAAGESENRGGDRRQAVHGILDRPGNEQDVPGAHPDGIGQERDARLSHADRHS